MRLNDTCAHEHDPWVPVEREGVSEMFFCKFCKKLFCSPEEEERFEQFQRRLQREKA